ncbi:adenylate kinase [Kaistia dalseonensis]|uniref:Adenylate kinase n=1 Tax=Kaistia dalseonensis TaxID=410840 RepID=A0ABU0H3G3_9HYPH|nr:adenylate kinase [Kaistia dalseonensis]
MRAKAIMDAGNLVSDDVVIGIVADRIDEADCRKGFILDGFPRTIAQAEALEQMLAGKGTKLDVVIELKVDQTKLIDRIIKRAEETKARGEAVRKDDDPDVFKTRLDAYNRDTAAISPFYSERGKLIQIDGMRSIDEVSADIEKTLSHLDEEVESR